jgi:NADH:ubiquinone oxidoreductase subunit K
MAINLNLFFSTLYLGNILGQIFIYSIIVISGAELAIFLSFFIVFYKKVYLMDITENFKNIKF